MDNGSRRSGEHDKAKSDRDDRDGAIGGHERKERDSDRGDRDHGDRERGDRLSVRVGAVVPEARRLVPLREEIITRYPQYRGYDSVVENGEIIIIEPSTRKIVKTISEGSVGAGSRATDCR